MLLNGKEMFKQLFSNNYRKQKIHKISICTDLRSKFPLILVKIKTLIELFTYEIFHVVCTAKNILEALPCCYMLYSSWLGFRGPAQMQLVKGF